MNSKIDLQATFLLIPLCRFGLDENNLNEFQNCGSRMVDWDKEIKRDFTILSRAAMSVTQATRGMTADDERYVDADALFFKLYGHISSAIALFEMQHRPNLRSELTGFEGDFADYWSVFVLARAAWECFLTFHFVYIEPDTQHKKDLRYWAWRLGALVERQRFTVTSPEGIKKMEIERKQIDELKKYIEGNEYFKTKLSDPQRKGILKGKWRIEKYYHEIAESAGLDELHAKEVYRFLCEYAHSGNMSAFQIRAGNLEVARGMALNALRIMMISFANFISSWAILCPVAKSILDSADSRNVIGFWIGLAKGDNDNSL